MALGKFSANPASEAVIAGFRAIHLAKKGCLLGKKALWLDPLKNFFAEAAFLESLIKKSDKVDPLAEDWSWVRGHMTALLKLAREFSESFSEAKRELGVLDFQDLEQYLAAALMGSCQSPAQCYRSVVATKASLHLC